MIDKKTVFILGAGASCPYGYPSGAELRRNICESFFSRYHRSKLIPDEYINLRKKKNDEMKLFIEKFSGTPQNVSVDIFLARIAENNPQLAKTLIPVGKYMIAFEILYAENKGKNRTGDWHPYLFDHLTRQADGRSAKNWTELEGVFNKVSFITFNYDRSLEHNIFNGLSSFGVSPDQASSKMQELKIIHIYGRVAPLDWQDKKNGLSYALPLNEQRLQMAYKNIRTIYEEEQNPEELEEVHRLIEEAEQVFCLAFGYASENIDIIPFPELMSNSCNFFGTALGFVDREIQDIRRKIVENLKSDPECGSKFPERVELKGVDCLQLLRNYL